MNCFKIDRKDVLFIYGCRKKNKRKSLIDREKEVGIAGTGEKK